MMKRILIIIILIFFTCIFLTACTEPKTKNNNAHDSSGSYNAENAAGKTNSEYPVYIPYAGPDDSSEEGSSPGIQNEYEDTDVTIINEDEDEDYREYEDE